MMATETPTLFIALNYSWMRPYVQAELRRRWVAGSFLIAAVEKAEDVKDFGWLPKDAVAVFEVPKGFLLGKLWVLNPQKVIKLAEKVIRERGLKRIVSLSIDQPLWRWLPKVQRRIDTEYVVHNVTPHKVDAPKWYTRLAIKMLYAMPQQRLIDRMGREHVNARWQKEWLEERYPKKEITYSPFPSTVTEEMKRGEKVPPEIAGKKDYVLFFGRVSQYKGVDLLVDAMNSQLADSGRRLLVVAGAGELEKMPESGVHINRYIEDAEVGELFRRARVVVYPYRRATQSGVLSVASYFGCPIVMSNVEYFKEIAIDPTTGAPSPGCYFADASDSEALYEMIACACAEGVSSRPLYERVYL